jgi:hypothetical protein
MLVAFVEAYRLDATTLTYVFLVPCFIGMPDAISYLRIEALATSHRGRGGVL